MCKALFFLVFRRNPRFNLIQAAVDLLLVFQNKVELFVQIIDDELAFSVDLIVILCTLTVFCFLAVLAHHDERRLHGSDARKYEV